MSGTVFFFLPKKYFLLAHHSLFHHLVVSQQMANFNLLYRKPIGSGVSKFEVCLVKDSNSGYQFICSGNTKFSDLSNGPRTLITKSLQQEEEGRDEWRMTEILVLDFALAAIVIYQCEDDGCYNYPG